MYLNSSWPIFKTSIDQVAIVDFECFASVKIYLERD